jgi:hypothetical protein
MPLRSFLRFLQEPTQQDEEDGEILNAMQSPIPAPVVGNDSREAGQPLADPGVPFVEDRSKT